MAMIWTDFTVVFSSWSCSHLGGRTVSLIWCRVMQKMRTQLRIRDLALLLGFRD
jgi:hypothetical protein